MFSPSANSRLIAAVQIHSTSASDDLLPTAAQNSPVAHLQRELDQENQYRLQEISRLRIVVQNER
eukprot:7990207-Pyramimonas_sp.AAC.1